jgi:hypothetical protein
MNDLPATLFPHSFPSEHDVRRMLTLFEPLAIFQPWFMEPPDFLNKDEYSKSTEIRNPPSDMKPDEGFRSLLSEYHSWIRHNQDKSHTETLKADQMIELSEKSTWEVRQMLRQMGQDTPGLEKDQSIRWHLILHLAKEVVDQHMEADRMLSLLKQKNSLLEGIVEEGEYGKDILADLPQFKSESLMTEHHLRPIFEAWFALFGRYLKGDALLITPDRYVMDYVSELFKEARGVDEGTQDTIAQLRFPDLAHHPLEDMAEIKKEYFSDMKFREIKTLIADLGIDPEGNVTKLETLSKHVEESYPWDLSRGTLDIRVQYLSPLSDSEHLNGEMVFKSLFNKTIICMDDISYHE